ncbi:glyoxylate/hydroxypyruvate reductase A [Advenella sp. WQ 585]|uniref:Glyoxylate/hydroxypyruvate reductase A n=1 Tax=Advenella mandrilli TaxID=2800330 RepID=A0ABS1E9A9_9BURK|nr:glyoxylate/hydroxypyruvate reductase A [Advenella mandrilli]MBK1780322.1 glyoxylate/hydroxypyruvate reductase A [Advenella mandrilli]
MNIILASESREYANNWLKIIKENYPHWHAFVYEPGMRQPDVAVSKAIVWRPPASLFASYPGLKYLFNMGAGVDAILQQAGLPANIQIVRLEDAGLADKMLEYVIHYLSKITRPFDQYARFQQQQQWKPLPELAASQVAVGVMGLGVIGQKIAQALAGLGYTVHGWSRTERKLQDVHTYAGETGLSAFLQNTQVLINVLPLTQQTHGILNRQTLAQLRAPASLINIGRGEHLNEEDLLELMKSGHIGKAVLDVFSTEPLPHGHPFWGHPNIIVTPHVSGPTNDPLALAQINQKIVNLENGREIGGIVSREAGY